MKSQGLAFVRCRPCSDLDESNGSRHSVAVAHFKRTYRHTKRPYQRGAGFVFAYRMLIVSSLQKYNWKVTVYYIELRITSAHNKIVSQLLFPLISFLKFLLYFWTHIGSHKIESELDRAAEQDLYTEKGMAKYHGLATRDRYIHKLILQCPRLENAFFVTCHSLGFFIKVLAVWIKTRHLCLRNMIRSLRYNKTRVSRVG